MVGSVHPESVDIFEKGIDILFRVLLKRNSFCASAFYRLIIHICDIHHVCDFVAHKNQESFEQVFKSIGSEIADMGMIIDSRPAGVEFDFPFFQGLKGL